MIELERRWARDVLSGFASAGADDAEVEAEVAGGRPRLVPRPGEVDFVAAYEGMIHNGTFMSGLGMRLALALAALSPLWLTGRLSRFGALSGEARAALLERLLHHPIFLVAELTLLLKLCACMALFSSPSVRARSFYDKESTRDDDDDTAGEQPPLAPTARAGAHRLPVVSAAEVSK